MSKKSKKKKLLESTTKPKEDRLEWIFLIGIILVVCLPLLNLPPLFSPPGFGKAIIFRIIVGILLFLFIVKSLFSRSQRRGNVAFETFRSRASLVPRQGGASEARTERTSRWKRVSVSKKLLSEPLFYLAALFFVFLLATIFSLDWHHSLFDTPYRNGGSLNFFFYIIFAFLAFATIKDEKKWQKIWLAVLIVGLLTCLIGIEQRFGLMKGKFIIYTGEQSPSSLGGAIFFGNYLVLLTFVSLAFGIKEKGWKKRLFYLFSFSIFVFSLIFCAEKRGPLAGFIVGMLWFVFAYPLTSLKKWWKISPQLWLKSVAAILCLLGLFGLYFLKTHPQVASLFKENKVLYRPIYILLNMYSSFSSLDPSRTSSWKVSLVSIKEKPIWGWGPENFSVAFDKNYDPSLPGLQHDPYLYTSWWDKPHNILAEYSISAGILGLLAFLSLLGTLFWRLQKLKNAEICADSNAEKTLNNYALIAHGVQATFLAYLVALFFSFDTPSTYIILFLLVGFSLYLLKLADGADKADSADIRQIRPNPRNPLIRKWRWPTIIFLFVILIWFIWSLNLKPLQINKEINIAIAQSNAKNCQGATTIMENLLKRRSFLDSYLRLKYIIILDNCIEQQPEKSLDFAKKAWEISKENTKIRPTYIRNWIFLGGYTNMLMEAENNPEKIKELKKEANFAFEKALELSPKKQEVYLEWIKTDLLTGEYQKAKEKVEKCIVLNLELWDCHWLEDLTDIYLGKFKEVDEKFSKSSYPYGRMTKDYLLQVAKVFGDVKYYPPLVEIYQNVISRYEPNNPQYRAALAFVYKELGMYAEAKKEAEKILEIAPEAKLDVEKFLKELLTD